MAEAELSDVFNLFDMRGRTALVTGAGGHLGGSLAKALADAGCRVAVTSRDAARAASVAASLPSPFGVEHFGLSLDQLDDASIANCVEGVIDKSGRIDVLVNNAHEATGADWKNVTAEQFDQQLRNATAYFILARHVRNDAVRRCEAASIIMVGSMYGLVSSYPDAYKDLTAASPVAYHALKGGIAQLTRHLAVYWAADRVRVNCLSPGPFPAETANTQLLERLKTKVPLGRLGVPQELTGALLLLASDAGSYITGHNLVVDGGWTAC